MKLFIKRLLNSYKLDIIRYPSIGNVNFLKILKHYQVNTVLDVGANVGQYAIELKRIGFKGNILSFEPVKAAFEKLIKAKKNCSTWHCLNLALGDEDKVTTINIASNLVSSSISNPTNNIKLFGEIDFSSNESINVRMLDSIWEKM